MKKLCFFLVLALSLVWLCGCTHNKLANADKNNTSEKMIEYMNEKYTDDSFDYKGPSGGGVGSDTKTIIVTSKNYPGKDVYVRYNFNDGGSCTDNYLGIRYSTQTENTIRGVLDGVLPSGYLLFYDVNRFACPNPDGMLDFDKYVACESSCIGFTVVAKGVVSNKTSFERVLEEALTNAGMCCSATIYFDGSENIDAVEEGGLSGYTFQKLYQEVFSFEMNNSKGFSNSQWDE